jgi:hypothetical protein
LWEIPAPAIATDFCGKIFHPYLTFFTMEELLREVLTWDGMAQTLESITEEEHNRGYYFALKSILQVCGSELSVNAKRLNLLLYTGERR